jgi:2-hydroxychromene-2-carboxylate isomerase
VEVSGTAAAFYFDLASPLAYLAAERVLHVLGEWAPAGVEWRPVLARDLAGAAGQRAAHDAPCAADDAQALARGLAPQDVSRAEIERRARELGVQELRWPQPFPFDSALAMRVASYAASIGRGAPFAQAAFRQAFAGAHSLQDEDFVLVAAAACEMHPAAVLRAAALRSTAQRLATTTAAAARAGVTGVPAISLDAAGAGAERVFVGERAPELAAAHVRDTLGAART